MQNELLLTEDGSHTIKNTHFDECYHSSHGARQESEWVFINQGLKRSNKSCINILEIGFGTGLNALLALQYAVNQNIKINYYSFELFPLGPELVSKLNFCAGDLQPFTANFAKMHACTWNEMHQINNHFYLNKTHADFSTCRLNEQFDIVFFDAFSPEKQPELWRNDIFEKIFAACNADAILTTYCAKGYVRRNMQQAGFVVERIPGPPGKREMLRANVK